MTITMTMTRQLKSNSNPSPNHTSAMTIAFGLLLLSLGSSAHAISCVTRLNRIVLPSYAAAYPNVADTNLKATLNNNTAASSVITIANKSKRLGTLIINKASLTVTDLTSGTANPKPLDIYPVYLRDYVALCLNAAVNKAEKEEELLIQELMSRQTVRKVSSAPYQHYDFGPLFKDITNDKAIGIIGDDYKRLIINIEYIQQMAAGSQRYQLQGHSKVGRNRNDFTGNLTLADIYIATQPSLGADESYKGLVDKQGIAVFDYVLSEDRQQPHSGNFVGKLYVKWYTSKQDDQLHFDDIDRHSDGYFNLVFNGEWRSYRSENPPKIAIWSLYKVADTLTPDLNIGAGEFYPNPSYHNKGWADYHY